MSVPSLENITRTAYLPQTSEQVERHNRTHSLQIKLYVADNQQNRDICVQPLPYDYKCQPQISTNLPVFSLTLTRQTPGSVTINIPLALSTDSSTATTPKAHRTRLLTQLARMSLTLSGKLLKSQKVFTHPFDRTFRPCPNSISDERYTSTGHHLLNYLPTAMMKMKQITNQ